MTDFRGCSRRRFLQGASALLASSPLLARAAEPMAGLTGRIYKTLKIGMVGVPGPLTDKFKAAKAAGFDGIWASGFEFSAAQGLADVSLVSMAEHLNNLRAMAGRNLQIFEM